MGCLLLATVVAVSTASARTSKKSATGLTVSLFIDAQTANWRPIVEAANTQFEADHPGVKVFVKFRTWGDPLGDSGFPEESRPDVVEVANTQMTKYMAAGALAELDPADYENSRHWLTALALPGRYNGKTYGVPYYAASPRVVTYRDDLFKKAGVKVPNSLAKFQAGAVKLNQKFGKKGFSPVYIAGTDWYSAMSFVFDYGGGIAQWKNGKWHALLATPQSIRGLKAFKSFWLAASRAKKTSNEATPPPYDVYAQGRAAAIVGPAWFSSSVGAKYASKTKQFVMPSHKAGRPMPGFLGGSDLAIPATSKMKSAAVDWIKIYTGTVSENKLKAIGLIPNATNLLDRSKICGNCPAASQSWFVPVTANWATVENSNVLRTMLWQILTNRLTVLKAAQNADDNIEFTLNS